MIRSAPLCAVLLAVALVLACTTPPPEAYVRGSGSAGGANGVPLGTNEAGETCTQQAGPGGGALVYCGTWEQPSARIETASVDALDALVRGSNWRRGLDRRFTCGEPSAATILGQPALVLHCTRRVGGWPQIALATVVDGRAYLADGVEPAAPVIPRAVAVLSGRVQSGATAGTAAESGLAARRLAASSFGSNDVGQFDALMQAGARANLTENYAAAEAAYRAAATLLEKALGPKNPNVATPLMHQALQLSNEGRYPEADAVFARAEALIAGQPTDDPTVRARYWHYRGLDALNRGQPDAALSLFDRAETAYAVGLPPNAATSIAGEPTRTGAERLAKQAESLQLYRDPVAHNALLGVVEVRRNRATALRLLGRPQESDAAARASAALAQASGLRDPALNARLYRTAAVAAASHGQEESSLSALELSSAAFARGLPGSRPAAETDLLLAATLMRQDRPGAALDACRSAVSTLRLLKAGTTGALLRPCLQAYALAARNGDPKLLAEMFEAAQLAQGSVTSQQIAQATARLSENARDPRVADAIRERETAADALAELERKRNEAADAKNEAVMKELDARAAAAREKATEADQALQAASPNYGQLVQEVATAHDVLAALHPKEAFASVALSDTDGWTFLLRDGRIALGQVQGGTPHVTELVKRFRASMDIPGGSPPPFDRAAAQELYTAVFGGVRPALDGAGALVVAPTGPLLSVPFGALLTGPADPAALSGAPFLIKALTVAHVPAAANFVSLRKVAGNSRARQPWFGFGDFRNVTLAQAQHSFPSSACANSARLLAQLPPLPGARIELDTARKLLGAPPEAQLLGPAFTAEAVKGAGLSDYRILHFATHALLPTDLACESDPAIVTSAPAGAPTAAGALLTARDVVGLNLDAQAIILSACNTGGPNGGAAGESLSGLARSFFYAGARALLVTHWSVNDRATAYLVALTLEDYVKQPGQGIAASVATAQRRMLAEGVGDLALQAHPFYWAPLAVIGEGGAGVGMAAAEGARGAVSRL